MTNFESKYVTCAWRRSSLKIRMMPKKKVLNVENTVAGPLTSLEELEVGEMDRRVKCCDMYLCIFLWSDTHPQLVSQPVCELSGWSHLTHTWIWLSANTLWSWSCVGTTNTPNPTHLSFCTLCFEQLCFCFSNDGQGSIFAVCHQTIKLPCKAWHILGCEMVQSFDWRQTLHDSVDITVVPCPVERVDTSTWISHARLHVSSIYLCTSSTL